MLEIFIYLQKQVNLEHKTRHAVITHSNTSNGIKIPTFFEKSWVMMMNLSNAPLMFFYFVAMFPNYLFLREFMNIFKIYLASITQSQ